MTTQWALLRSLKADAIAVLVALNEQSFYIVSSEILLQSFPLMSDPNRQEAIVRVLESRSDCTAGQLLGLMEQTEDTDVHQAIVGAVKPRLSNHTTDQLLNLMKGKDWKVQLAIVSILGSRPDYTADKLLGLMKGKHRRVQLAIVSILGSRVEDLRRIAEL